MATAARPLRRAALALQWRGAGRCRVRSASSLCDAAHEAAAVDLELGLARAAGCRCRRACWRQAGAARRAQPRQPVAQQGQLDLGLALLGVGVLGEDVEDHRGAVDARCARAASRGCTAGPGVSSLSNTTVSASTAEAQLAQLLGLALADEGGGSGASRRCTTRADLVGAGGVDQQRQLVEAGARCRRRASGGSVTPTSTMRSRMVRSMSVRAESPRCTASWLTGRDAGSASSARDRSRSSGRRSPIEGDRRRTVRPVGASATVASPPSMCTTISPSPAATRPQPRRGPRRPRRRRCRTPR